MSFTALQVHYITCLIVIQTALNAVIHGLKKVFRNIIFTVCLTMSNEMQKKKKKQPLAMRSCLKRVTINYA